MPIVTVSFLICHERLQSRAILKVPEFRDFYVKFPEIPEFFPEFLCTQLICFKTAFTALYSDETCYLVYYSKSEVP